MLASGKGRLASTSEKGDFETARLFIVRISKQRQLQPLKCEGDIQGWCCFPSGAHWPAVDGRPQGTAGLDGHSIWSEYKQCKHDGALMPN
jgi:hypothetical protein